MNDDFGTPITPGEEPKKSNTTLIIIIAVVVAVVLCCCCGAAYAAWTYGDQILDWFGIYL